MRGPGKLYHFTAARFLPGIKRDGLTLGCIPMGFDPPRIARGWQWLTERDHFAQSWCEQQVSIPYRRDDVRLTIHIPRPSRSLLRKWDDSRSLTPLAGLLSAHGDPHNWWLFKGAISPMWIRAIDWNPSTVQPPAGPPKESP